MGKRDNPQDRFDPPTPENQAGQVNGLGKPLRVYFLKHSTVAREQVGRLGAESD